MAEQWECSILSECIYEIAQIQWLLFDPWFTFQQMKYHFVCGRLFESYSILKLIILRFWWFYRGQNEIYTTRSTIASFVKELNQNYNMTFSQAKRLCSPLYQHISTSALVCVCIQKQGLCRNFCHGGLPRGTLWQITFSYEIFNIFRCINFIR